MRHTRSQTRQRRSHHALSERVLSACSHCGALHLPHHMCRACGWYNGRQVIDLAAEKAKREKRMKEKRDRIKVESPTATAPAASRVDTEKPKEEIKSARGAAAKRLKDESASQSSTGVG